MNVYIANGLVAMVVVPTVGIHFLPEPTVTICYVTVIAPVVLVLMKSAVMVVVMFAVTVNAEIVVVAAKVVIADFAMDVAITDAAMDVTIADVAMDAEIAKVFQDAANFLALLGSVFPAYLSKFWTSTPRHIST